MTETGQDTAPSEGTITVADQQRLVVEGTHEGSIDIEPGGWVDVRGVVRGAVTIGSLGTLVVHGDVVGQVDVRVAGTLVVEKEGRISGEVHNFGSFTNHGLRAGRVEGRTPDDREGAVHVEAAHQGGAPYHLPERQA